MLDSLGLAVFLSIVILLLMVSILIRLGNKYVIRVLKRIGVDVCISDTLKYYKILQSINKDVVGLINIEGVCKCPVLKGDYSLKNLNNNHSTVGELYILDNNLSKAFNTFSVGGSDVLSDLTIVKGSIRNSNCTPMGAKFSLLRQYVHTLKPMDTSTFDVIEGEECVKYRVLYGLDIFIENLSSFKSRDRLDLLGKLKDLSYYKYVGAVDLNSPILILLSTTDIDMHMVVAIKV